MCNIGVIVDDLQETTDIIKYIDDSISFISFVIEIEEAFNIQIPDEDLEVNNFRTLHHILNLVNKAQN